jgi:hypothetical protein
MLSTPAMAAVSTFDSLPTLPIVPAKTGASLTILKTLRQKVDKLPKSVPTAKKNGPLAEYCCDSKKLTSDIIDDVDVWETWDQRLNVLIPHSIPDIHPLITRGKYGLIGLVRLLEHLVRDRKVDENLLDGKVRRIMEAINRHTLSHCFALVLTLFVFIQRLQAARRAQEYCTSWNISR